MIKFEKSTKVEWYSFLASMPLISLGLNYILYDDRLFRDYRIWLVSFPLIFAAGMMTWYFHVLYSHYAQRKYPELSQSTKRILLKCTVNIFVMTPAILIIFFFYDRLHILGYQLTTDDLFKGLLVGFAVNLVFSTLWEALYIMDKHRESIAEKELLSQMSLQQEFDVLKSQVNPHFLFNCFNTLSSLINEDAKKAEVFLDELSKVYRYLLRNNEAGLSTLENELKFIDSYFRLLKTRHGDAVQFQVESDKRYHHYLLPSLSLQLLVENAIKYGIARAEEGGHLRIAARVFAGDLLLELADDGPGTELINGEIPGSNGVGLRNTRERLLELYGGQHSFRLSHTEPHGLTISIRIPFEKH